MENAKGKRIQKILLWVVKIILSALALYLVYKKLDKHSFISLIKNLDAGWMFPAMILFNVSKIFSSHRLTSLFHNIGITITPAQNLRLYYKGMFYNLFLPGGIGGDVYKAYELNKNKQTPLAKIAGTLLYDRISGLMMLLLLAFATAAFVLPTYTWYAVVGCALVLPAGYLFTRLFFKSHTCNYGSSQAYSAMVQLSQIASVVCILKALHIPFMVYLQYILLFLLSSVAAVIPVTIGGAGARELVFAYGEKVLAVQAETGVAVGILFFAITAFSSLLGIFIQYKKN